VGTHTHDEDTQPSQTNKKPVLDEERCVHLFLRCSKKIGGGGGGGR